MNYGFVVDTIVAEELYFLPVTHSIDEAVTHLCYLIWLGMTSFVTTSQYLCRVFVLWCERLAWLRFMPKYGIVLRYRHCHIECDNNLMDRLYTRHLEIVDLHWYIRGLFGCVNSNLIASHKYIASIKFKTNFSSAQFQWPCVICVCFVLWIRPHPAIL